MAVAAVQLAGRSVARAVLERDLVYVTGKGGAGKTTVAAMLRAAAVQRGRHAVVCEVSGERRLAASISIDTHDALQEWMRTQPAGAVAAAVLTRARATRPRTRPVSAGELLSRCRRGCGWHVAPAAVA